MVVYNQLRNSVKQFATVAHHVISFYVMCVLANFCVMKVKNVYRALIRDAADEYLNFSNNILYLRIVNPASSDGSVCPACPKVSNNITCLAFVIVYIVCVWCY